ncbi:glutamine amidotransferase [Brachybacterium sp. JHP9]|uniref:Lipid II isoglutaminyl synthase (glutamine-hydrolyzing) subunit GatD n=1 Tax=Brachybacterium equifaecis TaxID=2910770 RepID=A0ABT0QWP1_9MICO|nr:glutamine amidotransferase [Brachybacterium equifaecis]
MSTENGQARGPALRILQLYPEQMNIYGDWGNTLTLQRRAQWAGFEVELLEHEIGGQMPSDVDLVVGGGGQDSGQVAIAPDLRRHGAQLREWAEADVPMLMICGSYQLFGHVFVPAAQDAGSEPLQGISILDVETRGSAQRLIGNLTVRTEQFGEVVGYENHSGLTSLGPDATALGRVAPFGEEDSTAGGNNGADGTEGAISRNVIGTYLHGALLPKNPVLADWLLGKAVLHRTGEDRYRAPEIDESITREARRVAMSRPR